MPETPVQGPILRLPFSQCRPAQLLLPVGPPHSLAILKSSQLVQLLIGIDTLPQPNVTHTEGLDLYLIHRQHGGIMGHPQLTEAILLFFTQLVRRGCNVITMDPAHLIT